MNLELLYMRAKIIREIRSFFDSRRYVEVDTPLLAPDLIPESCLEVFETCWLPAAGSAQKREKRWLVPSPEIWMKRLIALHSVDMYQVCRCFRNTESRGALHNPEFTMLEYYTMNAGCLQSLDITEALCSHLAKNPCLPANTPLAEPFIRITMEEAFCKWAGFSLAEAASSGREAMEHQGRRLGLEPDLCGLDEQAAVALLYDLIFIHVVEPALPKGQPVVLLDYPAFVPCLAKKSHPDARGYCTCERWELYINGIELANCYSEEIDPQEIRLYFESEAKRKSKNALVKHSIDRNYWQYFSGKNGAERPYSGVALGVDRLIMALSGRQRIEDVLSFAF